MDLYAALISQWRGVLFLSTGLQKAIIHGLSPPKAARNPNSVPAFIVDVLTEDRSKNGASDLSCKFTKLQTLL